MQTLELATKYKMEEVLPDATELKVTTPQEYSEASDFLVGYRKLKKKIIEYFAPMKKSAKKAHEEVCSKERAELSVIEQAETKIVSMLTAWREKEEQERLAEQARQNAEIKRMAEKEKEELLANAVALEAEGATMEAAGALEAATQVKTPEYTLASTTEKTERTASGTTSWIPDWTVEVMEPMQTILAVCGGLLPQDCLEIKDNKVKAWAKANNSPSCDIHGCRIVRTERPQVR